VASLPCRRKLTLVVKTINLILLFRTFMFFYIHIMTLKK